MNPIWNFLVAHYQEILSFLVALIAALEILTRLTPTTKDDTALDWVKKLFSFIPNFKDGGGTHE